MAALSSREENTASSASILLLSPPATAASNFFCCDLIPVITDLFCSVRAAVCRARLLADRVFAMDDEKGNAALHCKANGVNLVFSSPLESAARDLRL